MNILGDLSNKSIYQFARWPSSSSRSHSSSTTPSNFINEMPKLTIDNRNHISRSDSCSTQRIIKHHHIHIPTDLDQTSPPVVTPPSTSPEQTRKSSAHAINSRRFRSIPVRIQSTPLTIPPGAKTRQEHAVQNFPKQTHEQQKVTRNRKRRKQEAQLLADKYAQSQTWFQLKRSLAELKRLATSNDFALEPSSTFFHADNEQQHSFDNNQIHLNHDEQRKLTNLQCESSLSSTFNFTSSTCDFNRTTLSISRSRQSNESYSKYSYQPCSITSKPIHTSPQLHSTSKSKFQPPKSPPYRSRPITTPLTEEKRSNLLLSDLSNDDRLPPSKTPSPPPAILSIEHDKQPMKRVRAPSTIQLTSTIKLKSQPPRCRSANEIKSTTKISVRFIIIADPEHRIESWYHQYAFIHADDLIDAFQSKQKTTISAYFIDDSQIHHRTMTAKVFLQGKPFHIENDWKKYDLILISNQIYDQIMTHLQLIIKTSGKIIQIYQLNHDEDLKRQIKLLVKLFQQQNI